MSDIIESGHTLHVLADQYQELQRHALSLMESVRRGEPPDRLTVAGIYSGMERAQHLCKMAVPPLPKQD